MKKMIKKIFIGYMLAIVYCFICEVAACGYKALPGSLMKNARNMTLSRHHGELQPSAASIPSIHYVKTTILIPQPAVANMHEDQYYKNFLSMIAVRAGCDEECTIESHNEFFEEIYQMLQVENYDQQEISDAFGILATQLALYQSINEIPKEMCKFLGIILLQTERLHDEIESSGIADAIFELWHLDVSNRSYRGKVAILEAISKICQSDLLG
ncbi:MAG: hypothetical protein LBB34_02480 [Holosporales bacterium]|jgi:hypothetical protein|nr:hypothetical protein [Holosporales bacterium]